MISKLEYFWLKSHKENDWKQMLQILPIARAQVKAGNTTGNLLNEIRQIIYYFNRAK